MILYQPPNEGLADFHIGQIVLHRRYGYRGVVVAYDLRCEASNGWYESNQSQPDRSQPWYHVLVDGSHHTTYAAQSSLVLEADLSPVTHPLLGAFFSEFRGGHYVRNGRPWEV